MRKSNGVRLMGMTGVLLLAGCLSALGQESAAMTVRKTKDPAGLRYSYTVVNQSPQEIVTVLIGERLEQGVPHLRSNPAGWSFKGAKRIGYGWSIPSKSAAAPPNWIPLLVLYEETNNVSVSFIVKDEKVPALAAGESLSGFEVVIARDDPSFMSPPFTVIFADGSSYSGMVKP